MSPTSFEIYKSINIKPWCSKISDARRALPELNNYLDDDGQLDFGDPVALNVYNKAVAKAIVGLLINVQKPHLIPAVCLRYAYVRILMDEFLQDAKKIIEIGTGASAIISQIASKSFSLDCIATEINQSSFISAEKNITQNGLKEKISLLKSNGQILHGLIDSKVHYDAILTYPPTYGENIQDTNKLNKHRGFRGVESEMIGGGDTGFNFTKQYLEESCEFSITHITVLCLFKSHVYPSIKILQGNDREVKVIEIVAGTRKRYLVVGKQV